MLCGGDFFRTATWRGWGRGGVIMARDTLALLSNSSCTLLGLRVYGGVGNVEGQCERVDVGGSNTVNWFCNVV